MEIQSWNLERNKTLDLNGTIIAPGKTTIEILTNYRNSTGTGRKLITCSDTMICPINLISGTDFSTANGDITVYVYADNTLANTITITHNINTINDIFPLETYTNMNVDQKNFLIILIITIISIGITLIFGNTSISTWTWIIGISIATIISSNLWIIPLLAMIYLGLRLIKRTIEE